MRSRAIAQLHNGQSGNRGIYRKLGRFRNKKEMDFLFGQASRVGLLSRPDLLYLLVRGTFLLLQLIDFRLNHFSLSPGLEIPHIPRRSNGSRRMFDSERAYSVTRPETGPILCFFHARIATDSSG